MKKKKLADAKVPLPKFDSHQEAADYFDRHSVAGIWSQLPAAKPTKLSAALATEIRQRHSRKGSIISSTPDPRHEKRR
jgi:hypothetical protein